MAARRRAATCVLIARLSPLARVGRISIPTSLLAPDAVTASRVARATSSGYAGSGLRHPGVTGLIARRTVVTSTSVNPSAVTTRASVSVVRVVAAWSESRSSVRTSTSMTESNPRRCKPGETWSVTRPARRPAPERAALVSRVLFSPDRCPLDLDHRVVANAIIASQRAPMAISPAKPSRYSRIRVRPMESHLSACPAPPYRHSRSADGACRRPGPSPHQGAVEWYRRIYVPPVE